jgi:hypothetical protein
MQDKYLKLLERQNYDSLTANEKEQIKELCSNQEEFDNAKYFMNELSEFDSEPTDFNSSRVKSKLDETFSQVHSLKEGGGWFHFLFPPLTPIMRSPGLRFAMVIVLALGSYLVLEFMSFDSSVQVPKLAENTKLKTEQNTEKELSNEKISNTLKVLPTDSDMVIDNEAQVTLMEATLTPLVSSSQEAKRSVSSFDNEIRDNFALSLEDEIAEVVAEEEFGTLGKEIENDENHQEFLIPTVDESPELLDGLFVTF